jgi:phage terminase large subunit
LEEASQVEDEQMFNMLDLSIRGDLPKGYFYRFNITFNPWSDKHWLKSRFFDVESDSILALTTTYRCNEWIGDDFIRMMEEMRINNPRRYRIEGDGEFGISEGLVYENVEMRYFDIEEISKNSTFKACYGLDFGFNDPTTLCCFYISKETKEIYVFDEFYKSRVTNKDITQMLVDKGLNNERIICDSAEPKSIEELKRLGIPLATPCVKGKGSVDYGIQLVQNYKIVVNPRCEEFIREISNYNYLPSGKTNHDFSHLMDALRYGVMWYERGLPKAKTRLRKNWFV